MRKSSPRPWLRTASVVFVVMAPMVFLALWWPASAQESGTVQFSSPKDGDVLAGVVEIRGTVSSDFFLSAGLAFAYADTPGDQWFAITELPQSVTEGKLAFWDTTSVTDGAYMLRLRLNGTDGTVHDAEVGVQIRNFTSASTPTASAVPTGQPALQVETPMLFASTPTVGRPPVETPTPFPSNPAAITRGDLFAGFARGGLTILAIFLLWGAVTLRRRI